MPKFKGSSVIMLSREFSKRILTILVIVLKIALLTAVDQTGPSHVEGCHYDKSEFVPPEERIFCPLPVKVNLTKENCLAHHCLWEVRDDRAPLCFLTRDAFGYILEGETVGFRKHTYHLRYDGSQQSPYVKNVITSVDMEVTFVTENIIRFKLKDRNEERYEVPVQKNFKLLNPFPPITDNEWYSFKSERTKNGHFTFKVIRKETKQDLFDASIGNIILTKRFLQISTRAPTRNVYGLGENVHERFKHSFRFDTWPMFSRDAGPYEGNLNVYGVHPFYECVENGGKAHGVLFLNSNAMEYTVLAAPGISFNTIGGVLDFFLFVGENPEHVTKLYHQLIGSTLLPPYWSLGFHLSRYGYMNIDNLKAAMDRTTKGADFPLDVQHLDIDYMHNFIDFTYDEVNFKGLPEFIKEKKNEGIKFITILDPAIIANASGPAPYPEAFKEGAESDVFIKWPSSIKVEDRKNPDNADNKYDIMYGQVWPPGPVAFPDFFKKNTKDWWLRQISFLRNNNSISFDGIWVDMNEPAEFSTNPYINTLCGESREDSKCWTLECPENEYDNPEYPTAAATMYGDANPLRDRSICMVAVQGENKEYYNYDVHSLYGHTEGVATDWVAKQVTGKRSLVISRSTYPSSGQYMGHWLGDNDSRWKDIYRSLIGMLEFNLFGIPYIGADICGFNGQPTEEMCVRWFQLGAFYPFSRNHNVINSPDQDPGAFTKTAQDIMRKAMLTRYKLLPYLYTLFYKSHIEGGTVVKPLFHEYPTDDKTYDVDTQFMWGPSFLVSPILNEEQKNLNYYLPQDSWYDFYTCDLIQSRGEEFTLDNIQLNTAIPIHVRAGSIIPTQEVKHNTQERFSTPMDLYVYPVEGKAEGELFWDDGESIETLKTQNYELYRFSLNNCTLTITVIHSGKQTPQMVIGNIVLCSLFKPSQLSVDGILLPEENIQQNGKELTLKVDLKIKDIWQSKISTVQWNCESS